MGAFKNKRALYFFGIGAVGEGCLPKNESFLSKCQMSENESSKKWVGTMSGRSNPKLFAIDNIVSTCWVSFDMHRHSDIADEMVRLTSVVFIQIYSV